MFLVSSAPRGAQHWRDLPMPMHKLTFSKAKSLRMMARVQNRLAKDEPDPTLAKQQRETAKKAHLAANKVLKRG